MNAAARGLTIIRAGYLCDRADSGKPGKCWQRPDSVNVGVKAMRCDELRKRGLRTATGRGSGEHDPAHDAYE